MVRLSGKLKIYLYSALILTAAAIVLCSACYLLAFDKEIGYFSSGSPLPYLLTSLCSVCIVWFFASVLFIPKGELDGAAPVTLSTSIAATPACIISIILGAFMLSASVLISPQNIFGALFPSFTQGKSFIVLLLCGIFLIFSAIYFAMTWTVKKETQEAHALIGFSLPVTGLFMIASVYFDLHVTMNSPIKLIFEFAMLSYMLYAVYELRIPLGKAKPRAFFFFGMLTVLLSGIASVPYIVAFAFGVVKNVTYLLYSIFALGIFIYTVTRLCIFVSARDLLERIADQTPAEAEFSELDKRDEQGDLGKEQKDTEDSTVIEEEAEPENNGIED